MQNLTQIAEQTAVFILEIQGDKTERERLYTLGIVPEKMITVIKNPKGNTPLVVEVLNSRFILSKEIAKHILVAKVLDNQDLIFDKQHKKTKQRELILNFLKMQEGHFSLSEFTEEVRKKDQKIGTITVYRTLKFLESKGILEVIKLANGQKVFEIKKGHHDHIICEKCASIIEFHNEDLEKLQEKIAEQHNVELDSHNLKFFVESCPKCRKTKK